ncbi:hypothetical protein K457DRAFT_25787 [Linnemannia elongata AG-77]|uniref:Pirin N-terminal domain-containing protein n=1 Tax=Linnemannia elongata AG-77 TaxID=1314771 RepID=A0A197JE30_9FUNG|nr:hypothetical protein K457DRAFT_25787 [Linnemannia elongata AG-77]
MPCNLGHASTPAIVIRTLPFCLWDLLLGSVPVSFGPSDVLNPNTTTPFLKLDEFSVDKNGGFPDHPHHGFEAVTYMLEGQFSVRGLCRTLGSH